MMSLKKKIFIGLGVAFVLFSAWNFYVGYTGGVNIAGENLGSGGKKNTMPKLFKNIHFGTKKTLIADRFNAYDCSNQFESGSICAENAFDFLGYTWPLTEFGFVRDALIYIDLMMPFDQETFQTVLQAVSKENVMLAMQGPSETTDIFAMRSKYADQEQFNLQYTTVERFNLMQGRCKYMYLETKKVLPHKNKATMEEIMAAVDRDSREIDISVFNRGNDTVLSVLFSIPKMGLEVYQRSQQKAVKEDF